MYLGRIILGISNGLYMTFTQLYIQETSPPHLRGVAIGIFQIFFHRFPDRRRRRQLHRQNPRVALLSNPPRSYVRRPCLTLRWSVLHP